MRSENGTRWKALRPIMNFCAISGPRWMLVVLMAGSAASVNASQPYPARAVPANFSEQAVARKYCVGCHNSKVKTGGFAIDTLEIANAGRDADAWEKVVRKLRTRSMPPARLPRPDESTYSALQS